jgi:cation/acetate symporter
VADRPTSFGRTAALFFIGFILLLVVLALVDHFGLPAGILSTTLAGAVLIVVATLGVSGSTMQASEFYLAGRAVPAGLNGIATAAAGIATFVYLGLGGAFFAAGADASALVLGLTLGFLILTVAVAPYFRKSAAFGVIDFLGLRYGGRAVRVAALLLVLPTLMIALTSALSAGAYLGALTLGMSEGNALAIVTGVVLIAPVLGGQRSVTRTALVEYVVMALAIAAPVAAMSFVEYEWPVPPLTFGTAVKEAALLVESGGRDLAAPFAGGFAPFGDNVFAEAIVLATGIAALPHLLMRSGMIRGPDRARRAGAWALIAVLFVALMAPAYPAFSRLVVLRELADTPIESLPDWVFTFGNLGLVKLCGVAATSIDVVLGACSGHAGFTGNLDPATLSIGSDAIVLAAPSIYGLPYIATALVAVGALAAAIATAKAIAFALASAIGHDFYAGVIDPHASAGRQLILSRLAAAVVVGFAAWFASAAGHAAFGIAPAAIALSAGGLFPPLILAVWWRRANATGAVAGIVAGGLLTATLIAEHRFPGFLPFGRLGFDDLTAAVLGMPIGFIATIAASLASDPPSAEQQVMVDAIRRPGGTPFVQETESL